MGGSSSKASSKASGKAAACPPCPCAESDIPGPVLAVREGYRGDRGDRVDPRKQAGDEGDGDYYRSEGGRRRGQKKTSKRKRKSLRKKRRL